MLCAIDELADGVRLEPEGRLEFTEVEGFEKGYRQRCRRLLRVNRSTQVAVNQRRGAD